jgi:hypothetical protein
MFYQVDNPGNWQEYTYTAKYKKGRYTHHCIPTGSKPVTINSDGDRNVNGWEFFYKGWESELATARNGATQGNLFPDKRHDCLNTTKLRKYDLSKKHMVSKDALLFHQLLLPLCAP